MRSPATQTFDKMLTVEPISFMTSTVHCNYQEKKKSKERGATESAKLHPSTLGSEVEEEEEEVD